MYQGNGPFLSFVQPYYSPVQAMGAVVAGHTVQNPGAVGNHV